MRIFSRVLFVWVALLFSLVTAKEQRPNVVFILTDDQAPWALGLSGYPHASTPNLDKLFKQGMWLKKAYVVTPVCSPSRAALMTSRYGSELGIRDWIHPGREPNLGLDPKTVTWTEAMQQAGYHTGLVGNWKLVRDFRNPERDELFDLKNDPAESNNVIKVGKNGGVVKELHGMILKRMREVKDPVLKNLK